MKAQSDEVEAAINELKSLGREMTREKLLNLVINAPTETRMRAYVSLIRPAMDYGFFQMLSDQIEQANGAVGKNKEQLVAVREKLLEWTREVDQQIEQHVRETRALLQKVLERTNPRSDDSDGAAVDEYFCRNQPCPEEARKQAI